MTNRYIGREESWRIEGDQLIREVVPARGAPYTHTCDEDVFEEVIGTIWWLIAETDYEDFVGEDLVRVSGQPSTQVFTALAFLKERGCVVPTIRRRNKPASDDCYLDAKIEWAALSEKQEDDQ